MKLKLKIQDNGPVKLRVQDQTPISFKAETGVPIYPTSYSGAYAVTPGAEAQVLPTAGLMMTQNVTVEPIPNNYGLITWDGHTITVS